MRGLAALLSLVLSRAAAADNSADWRARSIYQVMIDRYALTNGSTTSPCPTGPQKYCGGTWQGLTNKLDYIQGMGFDAVWISPVTYQLQGDTEDGEAYHGYWQTDLYRLNDNFGTADDLKALSDALHSRGMYFMVDVVTNHFAWHGDPSTVQYDTFQPFNSQSYFHPYCPINYNDLTNTTNMEQCWEGDTMVPLVDLRTEDADVSNEFNKWISQLVSNYSIDGLRIDSVLEVDPPFWAGFQEAAGVYSVGEASAGIASLVCSFQNYLPGVLNYGLYFQLISAFNGSSGSISALSNAISEVDNYCVDTSLLGTFSENHDQPRFAQICPDYSEAKNVITFTMLTDGIPIIYEGQEQHYESIGGSGIPWVREAVWLSGYNTSAVLYQFIGQLNQIRKAAISLDTTYLTSQNHPVYTDDNTLAMRKGQVLTVLSNLGESGQTYTLNVPSGYSSGTAVTELLTCSTATVAQDGTLPVPMAQGLPRVYYPTNSLGSKGLCTAYPSDAEQLALLCREAAAL